MLCSEAEARITPGHLVGTLLRGARLVLQSKLAISLREGAGPPLSAFRSASGPSISDLRRMRGANPE